VYICANKRVLKTILDAQQLNWVVERLVHTLLEDLDKYPNTILIGIQPRGVYFADRIVKSINKIVAKPIPYGTLDITFYRDDINSSNEIRVPSASSLPFNLENTRVVLIDDVLYSGRTIRSAMDALLDYGRPAKIDLMVLIDRRLSRQLPIQPDYIGLSIDSIVSQKVKVLWQEKDKKDEVILIDN
jgi:pyrimidine operon attenuation protein / uracil phosphoribosyltransferase